ncbi:MAG: response regulator [Nitrospiraceae bacterium]|nr:response regulator [Nitrospiraceae bacterium]
MAGHILVVDDEKLIRWSLRERLTADGYLVSEAADGAAARGLAESEAFDLALLDLRLPDTDGLTLFGELHALQPDMPVIMITAFSSVEGAVEAIKRGAADYLTKPFNMDELAICVDKAIRTQALQNRVSSEVDEKKARFGLSNIVGETAEVLRLRDLIGRVAQSETTSVLLLGESGTGKDMVARALHYESARVDKPFVDITCTALPESLLESELFGYEKGAFTDAKKRKKGLFEVANEGTVFLDEIGDMATSLQSKLLRVLDERSFRRVGGTTDIAVDVRVIAATNRDLDEAIRQGRFREDLYYRLSTVPIVVPPLRERRDDIPVLAEHFLRVYNAEFHREFRGLTPGALRRIRDYEWPGNVRELRNAIERAVLLGSGDELGLDEIVLGRSSLRSTRASNESVARLPKQGCDLGEVEKTLIAQALARTGGNRTQAADLLGLSRDQIRYKIAKHGLDA